MNRHRFAAFALAIAIGACGGGATGGKAGGSEQVVLRMADVNCCLNFAPAVQYFVKRVEQLSNGSVRILDIDKIGGLVPDAERQIVKAVADGTFDLGFTGTRVFDTLGVTSFQALQAPMLIDSYALERAVISSDIPARMMKELKKVGVTGLAILADGLRKPIARQRPLLGPADWKGITFQSWRSAVQAEAIRALGATAIEQLPDTADWVAGRLRGYEKNLWIYHGNHEERLAPYVTANVNLWPLTLALFINPSRFAHLTAEQRDALRAAAREAADHSTDLANVDDRTAELLCAAGSRFGRASDRDLADLTKAFEPVYAHLEQDGQTKAFIDEIRPLKRSTPPGPPLHIPSGCAV